MPDDGCENGAGRRPFDGRPEDTDRRPGLRDATRRFAADDGLDDEWDQWLDPGEGARRAALRAFARIKPLVPLVVEAIIGSEAPRGVPEARSAIGILGAAVEGPPPRSVLVAVVRHGRPSPAQNLK